MVHFSVFGGHDGRLGPGRSIYISVFGGATLTRPPLAAQLVEARTLAGDGSADWQYFFFSVFGGATIKWPTLAEEYLALCEAVRTGALRLDEWDRGASRTSGAAALRMGSFSIFGGMDSDALPCEDEELDDMTLQRHAGRIPDVAVQCLMLAVGRGGSHRLAAVRDALAATSTPPPS